MRAPGGYWGGIRLNVVSSLIACIVLGIAVDDTIHFMVRFREKFEELGLKSPFEDWWFKREDHDHLITTSIEVEAWFDRRTEALLAHQTQVDPNSPFWFGLPHDEMRALSKYETFRLVWSKVDTDLPETDLFAAVDRSAR